MAKCPSPEPSDSNPGAPLVGSITAQHLMLIIACLSLLITIPVIALLIFRHLHRYTHPAEQRQIIRIILASPFFAILSCFSLAFYGAYPYIDPILLNYEPFALVSLFLLFTAYVKQETPTEQFFATHTPSKDLFFIAPLPCLRKRKATLAPGSVLHWYRLLSIMLYIYLIGSCLLTVAQITTSATDTYCEASLSPKYAHLWLTIATIVLTTLGLGALISFYAKFAKDMAAHRPGWQFMSLKLLILVNLLQTALFSFLTGSGRLTPSATLTQNDLQYGVPSFLISVEQIFFAMLYLYAYRSKSYMPRDDGPEKEVPAAFGRAFLDVVDPRDYLVGLVEALRGLGMMFRKDRTGVRQCHSKKVSSRDGSGQVIF